jgi:hypothetical protein
MTSELTDFSLYLMRRGGGDDEDGGGSRKPEYTGPLHENVRQMLEELRSDPRFSKVDPTILNQIIDVAIDTATKIGTHAGAVGARVGVIAGGLGVAGGLSAAGLAFLPLAPVLFPLAAALITGMANVKITERDRTRAKSQLYEETVKRLLRFNTMPVVDQQREFAGLKRRSAVRDFMPPVASPSRPVAAGSGQEQSSMAGLLFNLPRPGVGYARPGASDEDGAAAAGAGGGFTYADMSGAPAVPESLRDQVAEMLRRRKAEFPPMRAGERKKDE